MLSKNIFYINKIVIILTIIFLLSSLLLFFLGGNHKTKAAYNSKFKNYPGYESLLQTLQKAHPNWEFEIFETNLNWNEVIIAESTGGHGKNVVSENSNSAWICGCSTTTDPGWTCASTAAVAYYMDPRNSLNEDYIFQFEQLTYDTNIQTRQGVESILAGCNYMQGKITYYDTKGKQQQINKTYIDVIMEAAKEYNISPYHLASRIRQEQGTGGGGSMISGTWTGESGAYKGYYNYFNVGAYGKTNTAIFKSGLTYAKNHGWSDPEKAIKGGASFIAKEYIACGQDTLYLQKFNVANKNNYYSHQYMTNVSASKSEGLATKKAYQNMGLLTKDSKIKFKIPVYKNMATAQAVMPGTEQLVTQDVKLNESNVCIRSGKGTNYSIIKTLSKGTIVLRIELDNSKDSNGRYWDKVVLSDGTKGYISREYLTQMSIQSNCNESYIVSKYTNFRNGPGVTKTTIIKLLSPGQNLTVVEKGKYNNVDKEDWYRVKLADNTYGYVGSGYIEPYNPSNSQIDQVKVVCTDGLNVRREPSSTAPILKTLAQNAILTRTQKDVKSSDTKYIWDKITTSSGIVGYVVREHPDTKKAWIEPIKDDSSDNTGGSNLSGKGFKTSGNHFICQPDMTIAAIKKEVKDAVIKKGSSIIADKENVGTGYTIVAGGKTYTIIVLGDVNR